VAVITGYYGRHSPHANAALMVEPSDSVAATVPSLRGQDQALLEQIEASTAKHLTLEYFQAVDLALDGAVTKAR